MYRFYTADHKKLSRGVDGQELRSPASQRRGTSLPELIRPKQDEERRDHIERRRLIVKQLLNRVKRVTKSHTEGTTWYTQPSLFDGWREQMPKAVILSRGE